MIAAIDPKEYVPYGRGHSRRHPHRRPPGVAVPHAASPSGDAAADSADEPQPDSARWRVHLCPSGDGGDESVVEELYIDGSVLVCSRGPGRYKCFSLGQPVVDAVRCQYTWSASAHVLSERQPPPTEQKPRNSLMSAVCCVTSESVQSWTDSGEHFITPLPFQVSEMWSMKEGLLLRRRVTGEDRLPILFSVLHPLDDTAPVLIRSGVSNVSGGDLSQVTRPEVTVVCVSRHPSLCVTHDSSTGQHTIWKLRRTTAEEWWHADEPVAAAADGTAAGTPLSAVTAGGASCGVSPAAAVGVSQLRSEPVSPWSRNASRISGGASLHAVGASLSRSQSPSVSIGTACYLRLCASPSPARALSSSLSAAAAVQPPAASIQPLNNSCAAASNVAHTPVTGVVGAAVGSVNTSSCQRTRPVDGTVDDGASAEASGEPPRPDICLQRLWRDNVTFSVAASGGFVTCDLSGVSYVVLVLAARSRLRLIRYERGSSDGTDICGLVSMVPGRDALPIPGSGTMLVVQSVGTLLLYSGLQRLCKVHVPGVPAPSLCHSLLQSAAPSMPLSLQGSPFCPPRRSSLLPGVPGIGGASIASAGGATGSSRSGLEARFDDALSLLSPVRAELENVHQQQLRSANASSITWTESTVHEESAIPLSASLCSLKAVVGDTVIMEHSSGCLYSFRVPRPAAAASAVVSTGGGADTALYTTGAVVDACVVALRAVLPRESAHQLTVRWFCAEHAPGARPESPAARWKLFSVTLLQMLGYSVETLSIARFLDVHGAEVDSQHFTKRCKVDDSGDEDWEYLLNSDFHRSITGSCSVADHTDATSSSHHHPMSSDETHRLDSSSINSTIHANSALSPHISVVLFALHLVYEDCKLNTLHVDVLPAMARVLYFLACQLSWTPYIAHYRRDMPDLSTSTDPSPLSKQDARSQQRSHLSLPSDPPDVMHAISGRVASPQYPYLADVNTLSANMIAVFSVLRTGRCSSSTLMGSLLSHVTGPAPACLQAALRHVISLRCHSRAHAAVWLLVTLGYERRQLQQLPVQLRLPLLHALLAVQASPPSDASADFYRLIGREERAADGTLPASSARQQLAPLPDPTAATSIPGSVAGASTAQPSSSAAADLADADCEPLCAELDGLLWPADHRLEEASRQLQSQLPVTVQLSEPRPELNEHELQELHRRHLLTLTQRTMSIPVGRGMLELHSSAAVVTECLPVSQLCLSGRAPPRGTTVELTDTELPAASTVWPLFHNGVAAGLRVPPNAQHLDAAWILYNRPKSGSLTSGESSVEHAGVLMALGLCGHLQKLAKLNVHDYLIKGHDVTSLGVLLGLAACKRGTMDLDTIKLLSIHVESLLPPTSRELDIPHPVQVAAVLGVGLVYQGSNNRHMAEVLLREIGRPPGPEMENCADRESYALAAGLGLGMVTLGHGHDPHGISSQLHQLVFGGNKPPLPGPQKERYKAASFHIREGDVVNTDVTAAGATLALALMYLDSDNQAVADWLCVPETAYLLDMVRPDLLQLRVLARCLILWRHIRPTRQWVEHNLPAIVWRHMLTSSHEPHVDYQTMSQVCYYVLSGACLALGLRYAGTADPEARQLLLSFTHELMSEDAGVASEESGRATMENALCVTLTALAMVMSGTGDLETMRVCRYLRSRGSGGTTPGSPVNYGSHMAVHMSLGLLFLGGGRQAVSNSPSAVAALLCAFFPRYPANSCDNRYHLQALRHMYVLAAEPRLLIPRDVDTGRLVYCHLSVTRETTDQHTVDPVTLNEPVHRGVVRAPCLLPRLDTIREIRVQDDLFWAFTVAPSVHGHSLSELLRTSGGILAVKRKSGAALQRDHLATFISQQLNSCRYKQLSWWPQFAASSGCGEFVSLADGSEYAQLCRYFLPIDGNTGNSCQVQLAALLCSCIAAERTHLFLPTAARLLELSKLRDDDDDGGRMMKTDGCRGEEGSDEPTGGDGKDPECVFDGLSRRISDLDPIQRAAEACRRSGVMSSLPAFLQSSQTAAVSSAS